MNINRMIVPTLALEKQLWKQGFINIAGIDEAGKGPWAGPVTAGAVVIHEDRQVVKSVRDSKLMPKKEREKAFYEICKKSSAFGIGIVSHDEIDKLGIDYAVRKAMEQALFEIRKNFHVSIDFVLVDGIRTKPLENFQSQRILGGGLYHYSIAAGSILAKVTRDAIMYEYAKEYPLYQFDKHVGYGTKLHQYTLQAYGPCLIHRRSFAPVKRLLS